MSTSERQVTIREFSPGDEEAFWRLNQEWIVRHFAMELKDEQTLRDPQGAVLSKGGRIFFAVQDGEPVGCCALVFRKPGEFELAKMAVAESHRRAGIGRRVLEQVIAEALSMGVARLYLETNQTLVAAIRLYESMGFTHVPPERVEASEYSRANVFMELALHHPAVYDVAESLPRPA